MPRTRSRTQRRIEEPSYDDNDSDDKKEKELRSEESEKVKDILDRETAALKSAMNELTAAVKVASAKLQATTYRSPMMDDVKSKPVRDNNEQAEDLTPDATKTAAEKKVQEVLDDPENDNKSKEYSGSKIAMLLTGLAVFGPSLLKLLQGARDILNGNPLDPQTLPDGVADKLEKFVKDKFYESDENFWKDIGDYVSKDTDATAADQIMMLQYLISIFPLNDMTGAFWSSWAEAGKMAADLKSKYASCTSAEERGQFFRDLAKLKNASGNNLPRAVAAAAAQNGIALTLS